ncbi:biopolymer transporter ExbD [Pedobacter sp. HDW13]|uniref:biopolymer transporter ExbD n=1 Tax=unclassified Pedobacter TaxID=2628915 RepID=UPI000F59071B|nr:MULTISPECIES: biopolymer transporter ExbD [unclassified Pedobacter]QIL39854.1 biopolymer transporter ExbD [Pedobacter sp. HDW13]RQO79657.1 biopolymer transporter ExbD [Pedobacter sp. KBW01]
MPRIKVKRTSTVTDMTAMCDVASLLLTFFILTATARQPEPLAVSTPSSTYEFKVPAENNAILTIGQGKVFFEVAGNKVRARTLELMGEQYSVKFTPEEIQRFSVISTFGVPFASLKGFIAMGGSDRMKPGVQTGIPTDSTDNQLNSWVLNARKATKEINNADMRLSIKGDAKEEYPVVKKVVDVLQKQGVNKFLLVTNSEAKKK